MAVAATRKPNLTIREEKEQENLLTWAAWNRGQYPELALLYHIPNGGKRGKAEAARLKAGGVKRGVPDLCLPVARGGYHGLYVELKRREGGTISVDQRDWLERLEAQGYMVAVCRGAEEAEGVLLGYLRGGCEAQADTNIASGNSPDGG